MKSFCVGDVITIDGADYTCTHSARNTPLIIKKYELMGKLVTVNSELKRVVSPAGTVDWVIENLPAPRSGWVIGYRCVQKGHYSNSPDDYYAGPTYLEVTGAVHCMLVSYWPTRNPVTVPLDGVSENVDLIPSMHPPCEGKPLKKPRSRRLYE